MTPEQKATAKERGTKAMKEMKLCGFPTNKIRVVIKRLLKSLEFNWELIEAENYSILVDAIISFEEPEEESLGRTADEDHHVVNDGENMPAEIPLCRKRQGSDHEDQMQPLSKAIILKKPKLETDIFPDDGLLHNGLETHTIIGSNGLVSSKTASGFGQSDPVHALANDKGKGILAAQSYGELDPSPSSQCARDKAPELDRVRPLIVFKEPKIEDDMRPIPTEKVINKPLCHKEGHVPGDLPLAIEALVTGDSPVRFAIQKEGHSNPHQKGNAGDGCSFSRSSSPVGSAHNSGKYDDHVFPMNSSSTNIELASSSNNDVKLILSLDKTSFKFQMSTVDSILKGIEDKWLASHKIISTELSFKDILTEMCQFFSEASKSGDISNDISTETFRDAF